MARPDMPDRNGPALIVLAQEHLEKDIERWARGYVDEQATVKSCHVTLV